MLAACRASTAAAARRTAGRGASRTAACWLSSRAPSIRAIQSRERGNPGSIPATTAAGRSASASPAARPAADTARAVHALSLLIGRLLHEYTWSETGQTEVVEAGASTGRPDGTARAASRFSGRGRTRAAAGCWIPRTPS